MDNTSEVQKRSWASAYQNQDFICIETCSGYRSSAYDPQGKQSLLTLNVSDEVLGAAVLASLATSRFLSSEEVHTFFNYETMAKRYGEWVDMLMKHYGYKTKKALFKKMNHCGIVCCGGHITITPTNHDKLEGWGRKKGDGIEEVHIDVDQSVPEIGVALREAFHRCK